MEKQTGIGETLLSQKGGVSMARLTNEQIRNMSINEADVYTDAHPLKHGDSPKLTVLPLSHKQRKRQNMASRPRFSLQNLKRSSLPDNTRPPLTVCSS